MRLLVGADEREGGLDALELARVLAGEEGGEALVATVLSIGPLPLAYAILPDDEAAEAEPIFAAARERLAATALETRAYVGGSPGGVLNSLAESGDFDVVVVGSAHRGAVGRALIGSVGGNLLDGSPTDVAIAPRGYGEQRHEAPRTIGVAFDGSPESRAALERAATLAARLGARLRVLTVVVPAVASPVMHPGVYTGQAPPEPERVIAAGREAAEAAAPAVAAESVRLDGDPAAELVRACEDGLDLLVVGSRGYGPLTRVLLGSVSRRVVGEAPCPVIVVRRP